MSSPMTSTAGARSTYLDPSATVQQRTHDLLSHMTLAEKAGLLFHSVHYAGDEGNLITAADPRNGMRTATEHVIDRHITHLHLVNGQTPRQIALWHNNIQQLAADTRLGIPVTVSSDPRHGLFSSPATGQTLDALSRWPEHTGLGAVGDVALAHRYGDTVRQEFLAMGLRVYLGPMADIFSDPRWSRGYGTFGEDVDTVAAMTAAFIRGLRGTDTLSSTSVAAIVKHFPGAGPQKGGQDAHDGRYREQVYPAGQQQLHLRPFEAAFAAGVTQVMSYYGMPVGTDWDEVGFAFNSPVIKGLLRGHYGFTGIVCSDWFVIDHSMIDGEPFGPKGWGLEHLQPIERLELALQAGVDQFGGDDCTQLAVELVERGQISTERLNESAARLLAEKFRLGLFENRFVDVDAAEDIVGQPSFVAAGRQAQTRSQVLIKNGTPAGGTTPVLPLPAGAKVYLEGLAPQLLAGHADTVTAPAEADVAVLRLHAPYEVGNEQLSTWFHGGDLTYRPDQIRHVHDIAATTPVVLVVYLERPAVLADIADPATAVLADFGSSDASIVDMLFGSTRPTGHLPFDLPSSWQAILDSREDMPHDTANPLYQHGHGLTYTA